MLLEEAEDPVLAQCMPSQFCDFLGQLEVCQRTGHVRVVAAPVNNNLLFCKCEELLVFMALYVVVNSVNTMV